MLCSLNSIQESQSPLKRNCKLSEASGWGSGDVRGIFALFKNKNHIKPEVSITFSSCPASSIAVF